MEATMKIFRLGYIIATVGILVVLSLIMKGSYNSAQAERSLQADISTPTLSSDSGNVDGENQSASGGDEIPPVDLSSSGGYLNALPTPIPGESLVYFVPTDNDATATVLYLYNTDTIAHIVALRGFSYNGVLVYSLNINVGATSFLRLASDSIASAPPPSWATPAPIITNFTDFTYFASLSLPKGVKAEGYVLFNPGTGVVDPRQDQGAIPLRFSSDPATVFMPVTSYNP
jgi:hypothetical protein